MSENFTYTLNRTLDAPATKVWEAWTTPDEYAQWAHAAPGSVSLDVRPGGSWKATMVTPDGSQFPITGSYVDVVENQRLVMAMDIPGSEPTRMELDLAPDGDKTRITLSQACSTAEERDMSEAGSNMLLDGLASHVSGA